MKKLVFRASRIKGQNLFTCIAQCFQTKSVLSFNKSSQNPNKSPLSYFLDRRITFLATIRADPSARIGSRDVILLLRKQLRGLLLGDWLLLLELRTDFVWKHWAMQLSKFWPMITRSWTHTGSDNRNALPLLHSNGVRGGKFYCRTLYSHKLFSKFHVL